MVGFNKDEPTMPSFHYAIAGASAGAITRFLCQPFDVLKVRFQLQVEPINKTCKSSKYHAVFHAIKKILVEEGIFGLWKGHNPGQLLSISYGLVQFQVFENLTMAAEKNLKINSKSLGAQFICGSLAGVAGTVASFPFDVIRTRYIAQGNDKMYFSLYQSLKIMMKTEGPVAYFRGLTPSLILIAPQAGVTFASHNILISLLANFRLMGPDNKPSIIQNLMISSLAGAAAKTLVYPLDLSKKRLQLQGFHGGRRGFGENFCCKGMLNAICLTVNNEGIMALYKGLAPSVIKAAFTTALYFTTYDIVCQALIKLGSNNL